MSGTWRRSKPYKMADHGAPGIETTEQTRKRPDEELVSILIRPFLFAVFPHSSGQTMYISLFRPRRSPRTGLEYCILSTQTNRCRVRSNSAGQLILPKQTPLELPGCPKLRPCRGNQYVQPVIAPEHRRSRAFEVRNHPTADRSAESRPEGRIPFPGPASRERFRPKYT